MNTPVSTLDGEWIVTALGVARPMNLLADRKKITAGLGHNEMMGGRKWGWFKARSVAGGMILLDYDDPRNNGVVRRVLDAIRPDGEVWIGWLYLNGIPRFRFRLDRVKPEARER